MTDMLGLIAHKKRREVWQGYSTLKWHLENYANNKFNYDSYPKSLKEFKEDMKQITIMNINNKKQ